MTKRHTRYSVWHRALDAGTGGGGACGAGGTKPLICKQCNRVVGSLSQSVQVCKRCQLGRRKGRVR